MKLNQYIRTIRYLKWQQIFYRVYYKLKKPKFPKSSICHPSLREGSQPWQQCRSHDKIVKGKNLFCFLNETKNIQEKSIWNDPRCSKLWLYNLHYFDYLLAPNTQLSLDEKPAFMQRWIKENPTIKSVGWEPYPTSLRIVNWIKFLLINNYSNSQIEQSLFTQAQFLKSRLEYHILGNHLFANAKALLFAGLFFKGKDADQLYQKGLSIYTQEIKEQILADGGHFELSPMYHAIILEDVLDILQMHQCYAQPLDISIGKAACERMLAWLQAMTHPDGHPAFFNDTAIGIAATYAQLKQYADALKVPSPSAYEDGLYPQQTYCIVRDKDLMLICDIGDIGPDYLPGHAHADTLSFELSLKGERVFVNSGTSCYGRNEDRFWQRSTAAHNTLVINHKNSSEVWDSFRVGRRAKVNDVRIENIPYNYRITAKHNGYQHLGNMIHERTWHILDKELKIIDHMTGKPNLPTTVEVFFHFHPAITLNLCDDFMIEIYHSNNKTSSNKIGYLEMDHKMIILNSYFYPEFGVKIPNLSIKAIYQGKLPHTIHTKFTQV